MGRPSAADMLAFQLEQAHSTRPSNSPLSAPPSSSFGHPSSDSSAPSTPATPWTPASSETHQSLHGALRKGSMPASTSANGGGLTGLGIEGNEQASRPKLVGKAATRLTKEEEEEDGEEETDDELEDELNDFGYGARPRRRKEKKESLLDMLNSDPPDWMNRPPPAPLEEPVSVSRSSTFSQKLRSRFTSSTSNSTATNEDPQAAFSTLRPSRSAGNLLGLGSFRKNSTSSSALLDSQNGSYSLSGSTSKRSLANTNHSRDNLSLSGSTSTAHLVSFAAPVSGFGGTSDTYPPFVTSLTSTTSPPTVDEFGRPSYLPPLSSAQSLPKLSAKDATFSGPSSESTRTLADFLRTSSPPEESPYPARPVGGMREREESASSALSSSTVGRARSRSTLHKSRRSHGGGGRDVSYERDSIDTYTTSGTATAPAQNANIIKAAMVKLGGAGRRASLSAFSPGMFSSSSFHTSSSNGAAPPSPAATNESEDGTGDIRVDATLLDGLFGVVPSAPAKAGRSRPSEPPTAMGVREFVKQDEALASTARTPTSPIQTGVNLPVVSRTGELNGSGLPAATSAPFKSPPPPPRTSSVTSSQGGLGGSGSGGGGGASGLTRSDSVRSDASFGYGSPTSPRQHQKKLSRKPVPAAIPPVEELLLSASSSSRSSPSPAHKPIRDETLAALMRLQDRGDTSPLAVGESPVKGFVARPSPNVVPSGLVVPATPTTGSAPATPTSPTLSAYATPPITPFAASSAFLPSSSSSSAAAANAPTTSKASKRTSLASAADPRAFSPPPPETPLPAPPPHSSSTVRILPTTPSQSLGRAAKRLSTVPGSPPATAASNAPSESVDSFVDPPLSAALPRENEESSERGGGKENEEAGEKEPKQQQVRVDEPILLALEALRQSMRATADLSLPLSAFSTSTSLSPPTAVGTVADEADGKKQQEKEDLVAALLPTLRGMKEQMELGAALIGELLEWIEEKDIDEEEREGQAVEAEEEKEHEGEEVAGVAEVLLADREETSPAEHQLSQSKEDDGLDEEPVDKVEEKNPVPLSTNEAPTIDSLRLSTLDAGQGFSGFMQAMRA